MPSDPVDSPADPPPLSSAKPSEPPSGGKRWWIGVAAALGLLSLLMNGLLWQRLDQIQETLARQSADAGAVAGESRALAKTAQELAREVAARQTLSEQRLAEVALQRNQIEELMQSLSRSRDENLVTDIDSAIRLAQQQAQLTGSAEPLLAALRSADQRLARVALPRLTRVRAAIARDADRVRSASLPDVPGILARLDELAREVDDLSLANAVPQGSSPARRAAPAASAASALAKAGTDAPWWERVWAAVRNEARGLVRVSQIDVPEAVLLAPEQAFFLRENLKFKLVNARLGVLARQFESARSDVNLASLALRRYFDPNARSTQLALANLAQLQQQIRHAEVPRMDETLAALATAAAGR